MAAIGSPISREDYNNLRNIVNMVLGSGGTNPITNAADPQFGYGQTLTSNEVGPGDQTITEAQWDQLRVDINKAFTHQIGSSSTIPDVSGTSNVGASGATRVTFAQVYQTYLTAANDIIANRNLFAGSQRPGTPTVVANGTQTTTTPWSIAIRQLVDVTFTSAASARAFFNSGGTINFRSSRDGGTTSPQNVAAQNNSWSSFLNNNGTIAFGRAQFYALTTGGLADNATPVFLFTASAPYSNNYYRIYAASNSNTPGTSTFISFKIEWIDSTLIPGIATDYIDGTLSSVISETKSNGVLTIASPASYNIGTLTASGTAVNLAPTFTLTSNVNSINEGGTVTFTLVSRNYPSSKSYQLEISGVADSQLVGSTTGIKTITTSGNDTYASVNYPVTIKADLTTNPGLSLTARVTVQSDGFQAGEVLTKSVAINDTSVTPTPSLRLTATTATAVAGESEYGSYARVTATNTGTRVLNITSISVSRGPTLTDHQTNFPGNPTGNEVIWYQGSFAAGESGNFDIRFKGTTAGNQSAAITVLSDGNDTPGGGPAPGTQKIVNVPVTVIAATFGITTSPSIAYTTSFASDGVTPGDTINQTITITNSTGNATVTLGNPAVSIANVGNLTPTIINNPNGLTIAPGASRQFQVKFTGLTVPSTNAPVISIDCGTAGTKNITATVTGTQSLANITVSTPAVVATSRQINVDSTSTFNITNSGSAALVVSNIAIAGQNSYSTYTVSPTNFASIPVGVTQTVTVTSKRSRVGTDPATITITSNAPSPNNTKTVSFSMTSTGFTNIAYFITAGGPGGYTGNDPNTVAKVNRDSTIQSYVTGAEPNATAYVYHRQANGVVSGVPAGTTPSSAFASKLLPRTADSQGKVEFWAPGASTATWDVGVSRLFAWIPVGKLDNGEQQYFAAATDGNLYGMETFPNLSVTVSTTSVDISNVDLARYPSVTWTVSGGFQNQPVKYVVNESTTGDGSAIPTGDIFVLNAGGEYSLTGDAGPGVNTRVIFQTYKGQQYKSNAVTVTGYSAAYFPVQYAGAAFAGAMSADSCWPEASTGLTLGDQVFRYYRSFAASPGAAYTVNCVADDGIWIVVNYPQFAVSAGLATVGSGTFIQPSGQFRAYISWTFKNMAVFGGPNWSQNPGAFSIQVFQGGTKVWGTRDGTARGY